MKESFLASAYSFGVLSRAAASTVLEVRLDAVANELQTISASRSTLLRVGFAGVDAGGVGLVVCFAGDARASSDYRTLIHQQRRRCVLITLAPSSIFRA
jgi:hypothetical protein